jgi:predicted nucleotidyltransferase component of viral defense system
MKTSTQLNAKLRNLSKELGVDARVLRQNYMLERFLERAALSSHRDSFILKGGILIAATVGVKARATVDLDATLNLGRLTFDDARSIITDVINTPYDDNVRFHIVSIEETQHERGRSGFRIMLEAIFDRSSDALKLDISVGDVVTPRAVEFGYRTMFDNRTINVWAYNIETVLAEKLDAIIKLNTLTTRMKDFYDVYILTSTQRQKLDRATLSAAIVNTGKQRGSIHLYTPDNVTATLTRIAKDTQMPILWKRYQQKNHYASDISFTDAVNALRILAEWGGLVDKHKI